MHFPTTARRAALCSIVLLAVSLFVAAPAKAAVIGELKTAVVLVNFGDNTAQPKTKAEAHDIVFGSVSDFFWESSYQKTFLSGESFGWFTLPMATTCDTNIIADEANKAAAAAGANIDSYQQFIYLFPYNPGCGWTGTLRFGPRGEGRTFINDTFNLKTVAHEMGHIFGLNHSDALDCGTATLGTACTIGGYGDQADTMGNRGVQFNAFQKEKLGWLNGAGVPPITTVSTSGRYTISTYESMAAGAKALKILKGTDPTTGFKTWYYVEYRQAIGFDSALSSVGNLARGLLVRTGTNATNLSSTSQLLDMTPNSGSTTAADVKDGALEVGRSHVDNESGISITLVSADANGAVIDVGIAGGTTAPTCTRSAPVVSLSAASTSSAAGGSISYTLSLANKDSSACTATTFSLARSLPTGWTGALAASSLSLSPGASGTTTLSVTSPATAAAGSYGIGVGVSSGVGSTHTANAASSYSVTAAAGGTLSESVGTDKSSYVRGEVVTMSALVKNNGVAVAGASVKFTLTLPSGGTTVINAVSGGDGYARGTYKTGKTKSAVGSYQLRGDATSNGATASSSTGFSVR
jgi:hypothetical protein